MNYTEKLRLLKPETNELFDVQHANSNAELIDAAITAKASLEQVATMLDQIIATGQITDVDIGAVTTIREFIHNKGFRVGVGTQAEIDELLAQGTPSDASLLLPTNSPDIEDFERMKAQLADTGWIEVSELDNGWVASALPYYPNGAWYRRIGTHVYVRGCIIQNENAATIFTLPKGFRPESMCSKLNITNSGAYVPISVNFTGDVIADIVHLFDASQGKMIESILGQPLMLDIDFFTD